MKKLLTRTQVAIRLNVSEKTVARMAADGRLPKPHSIGGKPRYREDEIERFFTDGENHTFAGFTLVTTYGSVYLEVVKAKYAVVDLGPTYAAFELRDGSLHLRPWISHIVVDLPDHEPVFLSCEDTDVPELGICDLPTLASATRTLTWGGCNERD